MGSLKPLEAVIAGKSTFMQVARTATKGRVVAKDFSVAGKKAYKFLEDVPFLNKYVRIIDPKNLVIRYGTKGSEGSSLTGFRIYDGEEIVAQGAMGLDKTLGKKPFLQMRVQVMQEGRNASMNLRYNANNPFNGSVTSSQQLENGGVHYVQEYGSTLSYEYSETNNFSRWAHLYGAPRMDSVPFPNASQFSEYGGKVEEYVQRFTTGRRHLSAEEKLKRARDVAEKARAKSKEGQLERLKYIEEERIAVDNHIRQIEETFEQKAKALIEKHRIPERDAELSKMQSALEAKQAQLKSISDFGEERLCSEKAVAEAVEETKLKIERLTKEIEELKTKAGANPSFEVLREIDACECQLLMHRNYVDTHTAEWLENYPYTVEKFKSAQKEISELEASIKEFKQGYEAEIAERMKPEFVLLEQMKNKELGELRAKRASLEGECLPKEPAKPKGSLRRQRLERYAKEHEKEVKSNPQTVAELMRQERVAPYGNRETVAQLRAIEGEIMEVATKSKDVFLKEMGFDPALIQLHEIQDFGLTSLFMGFDIPSGKILVNMEKIKEISKGNTAFVKTLMRHELDHFQLFADMCKTMGIKKFKAFIGKVYPNQISEFNEEFNEEFWIKAMQKAKKMSPEELDKYTTALKNYDTTLAISSFSEDMLPALKYFANPIERRAYEIEASLAKSLGGKHTIDDDHLLQSRYAERILKALDRYEAKLGKKLNRGEFLNMLMMESVHMSESKTIDEAEGLAKLSTHLESMVKA